ncbi:PTS sugar transporter subunit IIB [Erysipelothrix inopinata]|uniref:PTS sugar transporter subunit IIB n=1 Tax=Erysipelothrix inopinata TaxID=225084 RepID=A0A7G9RWN0_9FIRM|nr:PTS sugar transporter subunit IIB [Erysipelothrix inopinata]QNN60005.1 PTS sugar transporter subunit IIB [Erysipelothrix inopinata]
MRKIVLLCSAGMSTSILVTKMQEAAAAQGYEVEISAHSVSEAARVGANADIVLLGPQVRFNLSTVQKQLPEKPIQVIDMRAYGTMNGEAVIAEVKKTLGDA